MPTILVDDKEEEEKDKEEEEEVFLALGPSLRTGSPSTSSASIATTIA